MSGFTYKCVPAPRRPRVSRERRTPADALAGEMEALLAAEAAQGWEYLRTDIVPVEVKTGFFGPLTETRQGVMVFRRATEQGRDAPERLAPERLVRERLQPERLVPDRGMTERPGAPREPALNAPRGGADPEPPRLGAARID